MSPMTSPSEGGERPHRSSTIEDPRQRLVEAGIEVLDELPLHKVFAGATTAAIAQRAGVTTGSFFHHFPTAAHFADALVLSFLNFTEDIHETVDDMLGTLQHVDLLDMLERQMTATWRRYVEDEHATQRFRGQMQLWAHHTQPLSEPAGELVTVGDVLRELYRLTEEEIIESWQEMLSRTGRRFIEPFTVERLATGLTAIFQGLFIRSEIDPDRVDGQLFAEVVKALVVGLTVPIGSQIHMVDLAIPLVEDPGLSPQARTGARRRRETRTRIVTASADLFADGYEGVTASQVAARSGVSTQTVVNLFRSVRAVAAATFARHVADIWTAAGNAAAPSEGDHPAPESLPVSAPDDARSVVHAALHRLAEGVTADREVARALLSERLEVAMHAGELPPDMDIRIDVPLAHAFVHPLAQLGISEGDAVELGTMLVNFVLMQGINAPGEERRTADLAVRLLPDGAAGGTRTETRGAGVRPSPTRR